MAKYTDLRRLFKLQEGGVLVTDLNAINESIQNILSTPKRTRLFNRDFGCRLTSLLFELMNENTTYRVFTEVIDTIERYEPRVKINIAGSNVSADYDNNLYNLKITYTVILSGVIGTFQGVLLREQRI